MSNVIPFPERPGSKGYCAHCAEPVTIYPNDRWPDQCPACRTAPFCLTSWQRTGFFGVQASGGVSSP